MTDWLLAGILVVLILIYRKLTERQRLVEEKRKAISKANDRRIELERKAWEALRGEDKDRFNDFHYEHAMGHISDEEYKKMKQELRDKTGGVL